MRSAIAEALMSSRLTAIEARRLRVCSAGLHAVVDAPADQRMDTAARALGVSLEGHRATPLTEATVADADLIFVMDYSNEAELLSRFPAAERKVRLLGCLSLSADSAEEISDPYTGDDVDARRCAVRVGACVDALLMHFRRSWKDRSTG